jgi:DNA repair exonuclease SbcCD nuclease subunit
MKLIHTADIHLDASFAGAGMPPAIANRRRQCLREVLLDMLRRAAETSADAVLIAGDLFDADRVTRDTVAFLREAFEMIRPIPVFIAPGNHDPATPASPYVTEAWPANVHIFLSPKWSACSDRHEHLTVHGFAFDGPDISANPFGQLIVPDDGRAHVAVAHGSERGRQPAGKKVYAPFDAASAGCDGLRYLALGHFHAFTPIEGSSSTRMAYSGSPEGHAFDETGVLSYLEIDFDENDLDGPVQITRIPSSRTVYSVYAMDCSAFEHSQHLIDALRALVRQDGRQEVARVVLRGTCVEALRFSLDRVADAVAEQFAWLDLRDETRPAEDYENLALPDTSLGGFMRKINAAIADAPNPAERALLERVREAGLCAYRGHELPIRGLEREVL